MANMILFISFISVCCLVVAEPINYRDCPGANLGHATSVSLSPCQSQPCSFKHGDTVTVTISFTAANDSNNLESKVFGIVESIPVPFPLPNPDGCQNSGVSCPLVKGSTYTYTSSFDVLSIYPQLAIITLVLPSSFAITQMELIFHEKQEGSLCAQHCLNALLQNQYFSAVDLAQIGQRLDERERDRMAEGGIGSNEYQRFIEEPSSNFDDSGFFSVQVITEALSVWGLDVVLFNSQHPTAVLARDDPTKMSAFICNYLQHWFCVRKLGSQWFNLNSLLSGPELISNTYLSLFLTQLQQEGYSIFIVVGNLPECEADQLLKLVPAVQTVKPHLLHEKEAGEDDSALKEALRVSKESIENDDLAFQKALQMSMEGYYHPSFSSNQQIPSEVQSTSAELQPLSVEELRQKRLTYMSNVHSKDNVKPEASNTSTPDTGQLDLASVQSEEDLLQQAIAMSMENS